MLSAAAGTQLLRKVTSSLHQGICRQYWPPCSQSPFTVDSRIKSCGRGPSTCLFSSTSRLQHARESTRILAGIIYPQTGERSSCDALHRNMPRRWPARVCVPLFEQLRHRVLIESVKMSIVTIVDARPMSTELVAA